MKIERATSVNGNLLPRSIDVLSALSDIELYNISFGLRHPLGIYNVANRHLVQSFWGVLQYLDELIACRPFVLNTYAVEDLLLRQRWLLYSLMDYIDDCENILQCFFPAIQRRKDSQAVRRYAKRIERYRDHIASLVNRMKHHQGILGAIVAVKDDLVTPCYFLEVMSEDGVLKPFSPKSLNGHSVFTFGRDLRFHLYAVYMVSEHLADAIQAVTGVDYQITENVTESVQWFRIAQKISELPPLFLKNEEELEIPVIRVKATESGASIFLECPGSLELIKHSDEKGLAYQVFRGDGVSRSFKLPLWDRESEPQFFRNGRSE